jgi:uncharacterized membrane protein YcaP (DUF421 family)
LLVFDVELAKVLEIVARVAIIYVACMVLLRVSGRREMSELSPMDLLAMLLLSETVSPALTGGDESVTAGLCAAATLLGLTVLTSWIVFKHRRVEKIVQGEAVVLIENGRVRPEVMRDFRITSDDLETCLHQHGMLHVSEVARAYVESDGEITMIRRKDHEEAQSYIRRRSA